MALFVCPECGGKVSDKAVACPHCGCPVQVVNKDLKSSPKKEPVHIATVEEIIAARKEKENEMLRAKKNAQEEQVLKLIAEKGSATIGDVAECLGTMLHPAGEAIKSLREKNLIITDNLNGILYYSIADKSNPRNAISRSSEDPSARKYDASIPNMRAVTEARSAILAKAEPLMLPHEYAYFAGVYEHFLSAYSNYYSAAINHQGSLLTQRDALKAKKIDPAIAGGLAQGIAGFGAGAYTAISQQQHNQSIDAARDAATMQVQNTGMSQSIAQGTAEENYYSVMAFVNAYPELESLFVEAQKKAKQEIEEKTKEAKRKNTLWGALFG